MKQCYMAACLAQYQHKINFILKQRTLEEGPEEPLLLIMLQPSTDKIWCCLEKGRKLTAKRGR